jgi:membrane protein YdbS with pleckstrin-like domain
MRIPRRLLQPDERVLTTARSHPIRLAGPASVAALGMAGAIALGFLVTPATTEDPIDLVGAAVAVLSLLRFIRRFLRWRRQGVVLTDRRLLRASGGLIRRVSGIPLEQISQVDLAQGPIGRLLNTGRLEVNVGSQQIALTGLRDAADLWRDLCDVTGLGPEERAARGARQLAPGLPFDQQDTGPLPRVIV